MADIFHWWGEDLMSNSTGDLASVNGTVEGQQRVLRRLLTNPGDYIWHPTYGAGLPAYIGQTLDIDAIRAVIRSQMMLESAVAQTPEPVINVTAIAEGGFVQLLYVDGDTGQQVNLSFDVNV
jgi:phage baseplate assembly protein W